jgi:RHS repeat-associated protein
VVWKESYRPYGSKWNNAPGSNANAIGYAGKPHDASTGLSYMGARYYDPVLSRFMAIDPASPQPEELHSLNRYAYANNNPYKFVDPDGRQAARIVFRAGIFVIGGIYYAFQSPEKKQEMVASLQRALDSIAKSESGDASSGNPAAANNNVPPVPDVLVGDQSDPRAGPNKGGGKHTSGPLAPANGGTGDFHGDLDKLTGGARPWQPGDKAPPGSLVGPNGIFGRPANSSGGRSIDIPANGSKPHENLHYP